MIFFTLLVSVSLGVYMDVTLGVCTYSHPDMQVLLNVIVITNDHNAKPSYRNISIDLYRIF